MSFGPPSQKQLVLLYDDGHHNVITSLPGFFGTSYFCARCLKPYDNQGHHACDNNPDHCSPCLQTGCPDYTKAQGRCGYIRVLCVTITSKPCRIGASFKWLRLPRMNGWNIAPNEDLVVVCVVMLPAWPPCTPTRMMCAPLLFFLHLLWTVSTSMTKNLCYMYSSTWRPCRTRDVTFRILSWPKPRTTSVQSASGETSACATSWSGWTRGWRRTAERSRCWPTISKGTTVTLSSMSTIVNTALSSS